jgi:hypothetical protein
MNECSCPRSTMQIMLDAITPESLLIAAGALIAFFVIIAIISHKLGEK